MELVKGLSSRKMLFQPFQKDPEIYRVVLVSQCSDTVTMASERGDVDREYVFC